MTAAVQMPAPTPNDRLLAAARDWLRRTWMMQLVSVECVFPDTAAVTLTPAKTIAVAPPNDRLLIERPITRQLFDAARCFGELILGEYPHQLRIRTNDGSTAAVNVPPALSLTMGEFIPDPPHFDGPDEPATTGWTFGDGFAELAGCEPFPCAGKKIELLKLLAESSRPVTTAVILAALWGPSDEATTQSVFTLVNQLKSHLRRYIGEAATITSSPAGYSLTGSPNVT